MIADVRLDLLKMLGRKYVIDHCVGHMRERAREGTYRGYVCDCLMNLNTILASKFGGSCVTQRYRELMQPQKPRDSRTAKEIIESIRSGLKALKKKGGKKK